MNQSFMYHHLLHLVLLHPFALLLTVFDSRITQVKLKHLHNLVFTCVTLHMSILSLFFGDNKTRCLFSLWDFHYLVSWFSFYFLIFISLCLDIVQESYLNEDVCFHVDRNVVIHYYWLNTQPLHLLCRIVKRVIIMASYILARWCPLCTRPTHTVGFL
jgi:hypothetical protein